MAMSGDGKEAMRTSSPVLLIRPPVISSAPTSRRSYSERRASRLYHICVKIHCIYSLACECVFVVHVQYIFRQNVYTDLVSMLSFWTSVWWQTDYLHHMQWNTT